MIWRRPMFIGGLSQYTALGMSVLTREIGVPLAIKSFNWIGTLWGAMIWLTPPRLFAIGFVSLFVPGGISGPFLAQPVLDIQLHDTYFVPGHFHLIMGVASIFGIFAATYYWFPKMFGRMMNESMARWHFWFSFIGTYAIFMPMHYLGMAVRARPPPTPIAGGPLPGPVSPRKIITYAAVVSGARRFVFLFKFFLCH